MYKNICSKVLLCNLNNLNMKMFKLFFIIRTQRLSWGLQMLAAPACQGVDSIDDFRGGDPRGQDRAKLEESAES